VNRSTRTLVAELVRAFPFPDPRESDAHGLLAYGGDLAPERLLAAYAQGVFPWYDEPPILWFSPDPRFVLRPEALHVGRSLAKRERARPYRITMDRAFREVITACREAVRPGQSGTWITPEMVEAYCALHALGFAHSVEAWASSTGDAGAERLVGGLYGVSLGRAFFGESMFATAADASKLAFAAFVRKLRAWHFDFVDCQMTTDHLARFGAREWDRADFLDALDRTLEGETRRGVWSFDDPTGVLRGRD
jgi:leucyl/phenylalanyl-tRNA--protein transferase